jgi:Tfp pilus assembly protein PilF
MKPTSLNAPCPCGSGKKFKRCCGAQNKSSSRIGFADSAGSQRVIDDAIQAMQSGNVAKAERLLVQAHKIAPRNATVFGLRGMLAFQQGHAEEALPLLRQAVEINPKDSRLQNFLGQVLFASEEKLGAERAFARAVSLDFGFVEAWVNLGLVQLEMHKPDEAMHSFENAIKHAPNDGELHLHFAKACFLARQVARSEQSIQYALDLGFDRMRCQLWFCLVWRDQGKIEESVELVNRILAECEIPDKVFVVLLDFAQMETLVGNQTAAEYWIECARALNPEALGPYLTLANAKKFTEADRFLVEKMESLLPGCPEKSKRVLEFALGKIWVDLGDHDLAFKHYHSANAIVRRSVPFDADDYIREIDQIIAYFSLENLAAMASGNDSNIPIMIVGTPRSGTTLTEQIVSSHSQVGGAGEMDFWTRLGANLMADYSEPRVKLAARGYLDLMRQHAPTASRITDKMPGNYKYVGLIHAVFPNAKIIHTKRHPIDACLSIYFQNFNDAHTYKWDLESLVVFYEQYLRLMAHWRAVLPPGVMYESQYEELVEDVEGESQKLMSFLGLEWEAGQLDFYKQDRAVFTASKWQARQPVYKTSKERWRRYEKHLGPLMSLLKYA